MITLPYPVHVMSLGRRQPHGGRGVHVSPEVPCFFLPVLLDISLVNIYTLL